MIQISIYFHKGTKQTYTIHNLYHYTCMFNKKEFGSEISKPHFQ